MIQSRPVRTLIVALFFATGICGLGYQVLWAKSFAAGVGHEFPAVLAVITAFMGGLALGSLLSDRVRWFQSYGWLEIAIGLWAALTTVLIPAANRGVVRWLGADPSPWFHWWVVFSSVFAVLLPATIAMGATFPAIQSFLARFDDGTNVGLLYSANTAGAMTGALASAFWLMPRFGIPKSILCLAGVNLICGVTVLMLAPPARKAGPPPRKTELALDIRVFLTGFLGIGFEIVMIRGLSQVLENTVFTFAALLATYLGATAVGAAIFQRTRRPMEVRWLLAVLAATCLLGGMMLRFIPGIYSILRARLGDTPVGVAIAEVTATAAVLFVPAVIMGTTFARLVEQSLRIRSTLSRSVALNTCGGALAPVFFGLILLPGWGLRGSIALIAAGYAGLIGKSRFALGLVPILLASFLLPSGRDLLVLDPGERVIFHEEGALAATSVIESTNGGRVLKVNSRFQMGGSTARIAEERQADIPLLLHPTARNALFIGLGTGITFGAAAYYPDLRAEAVELLPEVVDARTLFSGKDERTPGRIHVADGRRFVLSTAATYDVIVADLFHPAQDGAAFLYTREHFSAIAARLKPEGLFCQWLPVFQMDLNTLQTVTWTFLSVFPRAEAWMLRFNVDTPVIGLISRSRGHSLTSTNDENPGRSPELAAHLASVGLADSVRLWGCFLAGSEQLRTFSSTARVNSDAHPVVMFEAPRLAFRQRDDPAQRLLTLLAAFDSETSLPIEDGEFSRRVRAFIAARDLYLGGLTLDGRGEAARAAELYLSSVRQSAEFTPAYAQSLATATALAPGNFPAAERLLRELMDAQPNIPVAGKLLEQLKK